MSPVLIYPLAPHVVSGNLLLGTLDRGHEHPARLHALPDLRAARTRTCAHAALLAATVISGLLIARDTVLRHKSLMVLEIGSLILFRGLAFASRSSRFDVSVLQVRLWVDGGLLAITLGSVLIGRPFTQQYAREQVSAQAAATPRFKRINLQISAAWALAFAVIVAADAAMLLAPGFSVVAGTVVILAALGGAAWLTAWLPKVAAARA